LESFASFILSPQVNMAAYLTLRFSSIILPNLSKNMQAQRKEESPGLIDEGQVEQSG
jgi:hypothetical protein